MKFPINQLLYLVILGLLGLSGWQFWEALQEQQAAKGSKSSETAARTAELIENGRRLKADRKGPDYTSEEPWISFKNANLIGKLPPPPPKPVDDTPEPEIVEQEETPLGDICEIKLLYFEGNKSRVVVHYKDTANVQPPEDLLESRRGAADRPSMPIPSRPRGVAAPPSMPTSGATLDGWMHSLALEGKLWPPYEHIRLVRVEESARFAEFVRSKNGEESDPEKLFKDELEMGQELLAQLEAIRARSGGEDIGELPVDRGQPGIITSDDVWRGERSTVRHGNDYHIGSEDWRSWGDDPQRLLNEEVGTRSYSRSGTSGVQITKVSSRAQQLGIVSGDVVIAINGESVSSKAEATRVGKGLYRRGVRNFQVTFLSRGREVTRNYVAPDS